MKKILFVATVVQHFYHFHLPCFCMFKEKGWEVHVAASGQLELDGCDRYYELDIERSPFKPQNIKAYRELKKIIDENDYDIIHCHTPVGGVVARLAAVKARKNGTKVMYTAHGFHFCKGSSKSGWLIYYPIEKMLSGLTDCLITINDEDYNNATKRLRANDVRLVHGVGCDLNKYSPVTSAEKSEIRERLGFSDDEKLIFYAAELNKNKNQRMLIDMFNIVKKRNPNVRLLLAGPDNYNGEYKRYADEVGAEVDFLGKRNDVCDLLKASDVVAASSLREGLPVNIMEAMATGIPVAACENRGHCELIKDGVNGFIVKPGDSEEMAKKVCALFEDEELYGKLAENSVEMVKKYSVENVLEELEEIYF